MKGRSRAEQGLQAWAMGASARWHPHGESPVRGGLRPGRGHSVATWAEALMEKNRCRRAGPQRHRRGRGATLGSALEGERLQFWRRQAQHIYLFFPVPCMCFILSFATDHPLGVHWAPWGRESGGWIGMQQSWNWVKSQQSAAAQFGRPRLCSVGSR